MRYFHAIIQFLAIFYFSLFCVGRLTESKLIDVGFCFQMAVLLYLVAINMNMRTKDNG